MLLPSHRSELAATLNRAILAHSGRSEDSALEAIARQASAALQVLRWALERGGLGSLGLCWLSCGVLLFCSTEHNPPPCPGLCRN